MEKQRWKSQRREEKKREDQRRERVRRKKTQVREKVAKSRFTVFFQWFVAPEGRKVGSLKRWVRSHVARWNIARRCGTKHISRSKCTRIGRLFARRCGAKHIWKSTCTKHLMLGRFRKLRCRKSARCCGAKHMWKSKCRKHTRFGPLLEVEMSKSHAVVARSTFRSQKCKKLTGSEHFWTFRCGFAWQAQGIVHLVKNEQNL